MKFKKLVDLAAELRSETGCPWDRKQTISSLVKHFQDEVDEAKEAIEKKDYSNLKEELGDVLFNLLMICQIAKEEGHFNTDEVLDDIAKKIIDRHSWVFGEDKVTTAEEAMQKWQENKAKLRKEK